MHNVTIWRRMTDGVGIKEGVWEKEVKSDKRKGELQLHSLPHSVLYSGTLSTFRSSNSS